MFVTCVSVVKVRAGPLLGVEGESRTRTLFRAPVLETGVAAITPLRQRCRAQDLHLYAARPEVLSLVCLLFHQPGLYVLMYSRMYALYGRSIDRLLRYPQRDLNPHASRRYVLSVVCLPFHHAGISGAPSRQRSCILPVKSRLRRPLRHWSMEPSTSGALMSSPPYQLQAQVPPVGVEPTPPVLQTGAIRTGSASEAK